MILCTDIFLKAHISDIEIHKNEHDLRSLISNLTKIHQDILSSSSTKGQNDMISHALVKFEQFVKKNKTNKLRSFSSYRTVQNQTGAERGLLFHYYVQIAISTTYKFMQSIQHLEVLWLLHIPLDLM
jgi:hypothetical protein